MALHRSEEMRQQPYLLTFIALLCVDHCCWYVRMGSHCIETRDQVFTRNMVLELEAFYSFVDARNQSSYKLLSY